MPVFRNLQKGLNFKWIQNLGSDFRLIFENPSHFFAIFRPQKLENFFEEFQNFFVGFQNYFE